MGLDCFIVIGRSFFVCFTFCHRCFHLSLPPPSPHHSPLLSGLPSSLWHHLILFVLSLMVSLTSSFRCFSKYNIKIQKGKQGNPERDCEISVLRPYCHSGGPSFLPGMLCITDTRQILRMPPLAWVLKSRLCAFVPSRLL